MTPLWFKFSLAKTQDPLCVDFAVRPCHLGAVIVLRFEAKAAPGVYTIDAGLHDNIGGKALPLPARVQLDKEKERRPKTPPLKMNVDKRG